MDHLERCFLNVSAPVDHLRMPTNNDQEVSRTAVHYSSLLAELHECLRRLYHGWEACLDHRQFGVVTTPYTAPLIHTGQIGRPRFHISQHQLQYLWSMSFSWVQISDMQHVSSMTVYRRRQEYGMIHTPNGRLSDSELWIVVRRVQTELPALGQTMFLGETKVNGFLCHT